MLKSSPEQLTALDQLLAAQQNPESPEYQHWLTPEEFGARFGLSDSNIEAITNWLASNGLVVNNVARGRRTIDFSGSIAQVERAFQTEMHHFLVNGIRHISNASDLSIPAALQSVVEGVVSLNDFHAEPLHHSAVLANFANGKHGLSPGDFAQIYNVAPLWSQGTDGAGQSIAIVGRTNINMSDVIAFRSMFGLPGNNTQVIVNGADPGIVNSSELTEALLDVEWAGAVAKGATIKFVVSANTATAGGDILSANYIVNNNLAPVLSSSFGLCESQLGGANSFFNALWQQAAAQGMSVIVASGDSGAAGCDYANTRSGAASGLAVNGIASTPYNVAIGGTQFNEGSAPAAFWGATSTAANFYTSALSYIPEAVWNESAFVVGGSANSLWAGGGGVSTLYATPTWQTGSAVPTSDPGAPTQHHRYVPDVSLSGAGHDAYLVMINGGLSFVSGTSAGAPSFSGIMALRNQALGNRAGNPGPALYAMSTTSPGAFHDVVSGSNAVPCATTAQNCVNGFTPGFAAGPGFDLATGLGSVNAAAMVLNWPGGAPPPTPPSITALNPSPLTASSKTQNLTITGAGFQPGAVVTLTTGTSTLTYSGTAVTYVSASQLNVAVNVGVASAVFSVQVRNPNNQISASAALTVTAAPAPPAIVSLSPNPMTIGRTGTLTISGTGFNPAAVTVNLSYPGYTAPLQVGTVVSATPTQLVVTINPGLYTRIWTVQVVNGDGQASAKVNLQVAP